jgi:hypothetical protein
MLGDAMSTLQETPIAGELDQLVFEIETQLLASASLDARSEWTRFRETCAFVATSRAARGRGDDDLAILVSKARRFRDVLLLA